MEWLSQNWIWIVVVVGVVWLFARMRQGGAMGGCCGGHDMAHEGPPQEATKKEAGDQGAKPAASSHRHRGGCC